jgi:multidrug/hemolysin transport system permease protein
MTVIYSLLKRNLRMYFRDRALVFYSFMSVLIIIGLYALFLGNVMENGIKQAVGGTVNVRSLVDSWIMSGLVLVNAINVPLMVFGIMVNDVASGKVKDFTVSPIKRSSIVAGYLAASWIIGIIMELVTIALAEVYIVAYGGSLLSPENMLYAVLASALCVVSYSTVFFFIAQFLKSTSAFSSVCTIVGTLIGFVGGIYIPIGELPQNVQNVMKFIPVTQSAALMRKIFVSAPLDSIFVNAPQSAKDSFAQEFGIQLKYGSSIMSTEWLILITLFTGILFFILSVAAVSYKSRKSA